jgi:SAM-dependent methyltransferase
VTDDITEHNQAAYDAIAAQYAARHVNRNLSFADLMDTFAARLPAPARLADLGCGPGHDGAYFAAAGHHVVGLDRSPGMLALAGQALDGQVAQADLRRLPLAPASLDGVWCCASLLHVPQDQTMLVLRELRRVLRPGGTLALVTALGDGRALEPVFYATDIKRWYFYRQADELTGQLAQAGLSVFSSEQEQSNRTWLKLLAQPD